MSSLLLKLRGIGKQFKGVAALSAVDLDIREGEIHALLGENGAGKSTLIKVITGVHPPDSGTIELDGERIRPSQPAHAQAAGISTVYQEVNLLPNLSVAQNLYLGREPKRWGMIDWPQIYRDARVLLSRFDLDIDERATLGEYSIAVQQMVAIARGVDCSAKVLILDEPTASLDDREVNRLFTVLRELKKQNVGIVFVTHFLDQVYRLTDRITVLRNGCHIGTFSTVDLPRDQLIAHMLGKTLANEELSPPVNTQPSEAPVLKLEKLETTNGLRGIDGVVHRGNTLGLSGLLGSGRSELCETLFGLTRVQQGSISYRELPYHPKSPMHAVQQGFALCPEDRRAEGIVDPLSVRENLILALQAKRGWWRPLSTSEQKKLVNQSIERFNIACSDNEKPIGQLSGGNQQKVILARWLLTQPDVLILDEPTRGIDVGAHAEILKLIKQLCSEGMTLVVASSEIEELVAFSNKVFVLRDKKVSATLSGDQLTENAILSAITQSA